MIHFENGPKKATNLTLNAKVLEMAKSMGMNISQTVDALLAKEVERRYWERWNEDNKEAVAAYNERIRRDGIWGSQYRSFARGLGDGREADEAPSSQKAA
ncbi:type II toxin-antitoxin system CcdA family antitoxin [Hydrogenophaga defluvii]|uniref:Type II toxin-antitoxin system CcdA family antitoxin n=1 Tax=Hydrogenophaga defluvii TaxID=249410 RepID=A0ABW2S9G0_9BURK